MCTSTHICTQTHAYTQICDSKSQHRHVHTHPHSHTYLSTHVHTHPHHTHPHAHILTHTGIRAVKTWHQISPFFRLPSGGNIPPPPQNNSFEFWWKSWGFLSIDQLLGRTENFENRPLPKSLNKKLGVPETFWAFKEICLWKNFLLQSLLTRFFATNLILHNLHCFQE